MFRSSLVPGIARRRLLAGLEGRVYLGSYIYTPSLRIMVVKRFTSSIFVARNATLIVKLRGIVAKSSDAVLSYLGGILPGTICPEIPRFISFYALAPPDIRRCPIFHLPACPPPPPEGETSKRVCIRYNRANGKRQAGGIGGERDVSRIFIPCKNPPSI